MKYFKQSWDDIGNKCLLSIYPYDTTKMTPYNLVESWILSKETREEFGENPNCINNTTSEKAKIRQERLDIFLPHLEKEYPDFIKAAKKQNFILKLIKFNDILSLAIPLIVCYFTAKLIFFASPIIYDTIMQKANSNSNSELINAAVVSLSFALFGFVWFLSCRIGDRLPYIITYPSIIRLRAYDFGHQVRLNKDAHLRSFYRKTPYTVAFLMGNGFVDRLDFGPSDYDKDYLMEMSNFVVPSKEIKNLNFNEFINYMKLRVEPAFKSYHRIHEYVDAPKYVKYKSLQSLFFYLNEEDLKNTTNLRSKTIKSSQFKNNIERYERPSEPSRNEYGQVIHRRNYDTKRDESDYAHKSHYSPRPSNPKAKVKKPSSLDRAIAEWKEQEFISSLLDRRK